MNQIIRNSAMFLTVLSAVSAVATAQGRIPGGQHLICTRDDDGSWRAAGLTSDVDKANRTVATLRGAGIEARVLQYLPLPSEIQELPLIPGQRAIGLAVNLSGEVYGVTRSGRMFAVPLGKRSYRQRGLRSPILTHPKSMSDGEAA